MSEQPISREDVEKQTTYVGPNWWPIRQLARNLLAADDALKLAEHKIEQTLDGQYPEGQALQAALYVVRAAMLPREASDV